jgi:UDP-N-acetyl-D-glucosamine dehydrogenase
MELKIKNDLIRRLKDHSAVVSVLGLGYVGLPLAVVFAEAGFKVIGIDPVQSKVDALNHGESYVMDVPSTAVARLVRSWNLAATSDFSALLT